uniref:Uncharacterized protein n=1 Tax=Opuntia streptacantha TaxID=393608 RepID=A0A7C8ZHL3_OPUST
MPRIDDVQQQLQQNIDELQEQVNKQSESFTEQLAGHKEFLSDQLAIHKEAQDRSNAQLKELITGLSVQVMQLANRVGDSSPHGVTTGIARLLRFITWECRPEIKREEKSSINFC